MNEPSPIRGRWTLTVARNGTAIFDTKAREDLGERRVEVVPVPDEQAIERAAKYLFFGPEPERAKAWPVLSAEVRQTFLDEARAVLTAALEQPE